MDENTISFKCIELTQPIGKFYIGSIPADDLLKIAYADIRRIEERDVEQYLGIQRPLSEYRVKELKEYVRSVDATFPTSIILAISSENAEYDPLKFMMTVTADEKVAKIIDGQHRIAGLEGYDDSFQLNVTIFIDMDIEDQAMVFATINLKQTKVNRSLAYDLYDYAKIRSPQRTCHNAAKLLNNKTGSPLKGKIKILGLATGQPGESITQATFVERLLRYISGNDLQALKDRNIMKAGEKLNRVGIEEERRLIFRNMFIEERDAEIAKVIWNYFSAVANKWPNAWDKVERGNILNRTTGFAALMRFLRDAYLSVAAPGEPVKEAEFINLFKRIALKDSNFTPENYKPGSAGESQLYKDLKLQAGIE